MVSKENLASILMFVPLYVPFLPNWLFNFLFYFWSFSNLTVMCSFFLFSFYLFCLDFAKSLGYVELVSFIIFENSWLLSLQIFCLIFSLSLFFFLRSQLYEFTVIPKILYILFKFFLYLKNSFLSSLCFGLDN